MRCPFCSGDDTQVVDTRSNEGTNVIRRRRKCPKCDKRFTTYERVELRMPRLVKKGGSRTDFDRNKLVGSMTLALRKRPVATEDVDAAVDRIEEKLRVGCVLAQGETIVGEGWHEKTGGPHAEVVAIGQAGVRAAGATLYVNLEPCNHQGRTPPCVDLILASKIKRVVAAMLDPNPK